MYHYGSALRKRLNRLDDQPRPKSARDSGRISADEAAERAGVARVTIFRWLREGRLAGYRQRGDRHTFIGVAQLDRLTRPQRVTYRPLRDPQ